MPRISNHTTSLGIIAVGMLAWAFAGHHLIDNADLKSPLNPLGINGSPYGEVFAMAMQGPIDTYANIGIMGRTITETPKPLTKSGFHAWLSTLNQAAVTRTNPQAAGDALKRHLRRQAEKKLRFAYQLDPAHYGNYNSLHFFLSEPSLGTHPELTPSAAKLAHETISYCLKQEHDPRPALTAAAAATNIMFLMFEEKSKFSINQMLQGLNTLDQCIARYDQIAKKWDQSKSWRFLSADRINECNERFDFICKIRDTAEKTILNLKETQSVN